MTARKKTPICGAKRKQGKGICHATALYPNGRCRVHGGPTPIGPANPNYRTGTHSKWGILPTGLAGHYARTSAQTDAALMTLTGELALIDARVAEQLAAIGTTGSAKLWGEARAKFEAFKVAGAQKGQLGSARVALEQLEGILEKGSAGSITWDNLLELLEARRKMVETESRRRKDAQETLSLRQGMGIVQLVAQVVRETVRDPNERAAVFMGLQKILRPVPAVVTEDR